VKLPPLINEHTHLLTIGPWNADVVGVLDEDDIDRSFARSMPAWRAISTPSYYRFSKPWEQEEQEDERDESGGISCAQVSCLNSGPVEGWFSTSNETNPPLL
jgi:hypothetical protein